MRHKALASISTSHSLLRALLKDIEARDLLPELLPEASVNDIGFFDPTMTCDVQHLRLYHRAEDFGLRLQQCSKQYREESIVKVLPHCLRGSAFNWFKTYRDAEVTRRTHKGIDEGLFYICCFTYFAFFIFSIVFSNSYISNLICNTKSDVNSLTKTFTHFQVYVTANTTTYFFASADQSECEEVLFYNGRPLQHVRWNQHQKGWPFNHTEGFAFFIYHITWPVDQSEG